MSSTRTKAPSSGLYIPREGVSPSAAIDQSTLHDSIESALAGIENYARREPWTFATCVFGVGFILGWKLKPW